MKMSTHLEAEISTDFGVISASIKKVVKNI